MISFPWTQINSLSSAGPVRPPIASFVEKGSQWSIRDATTVLENVLNPAKCFRAMRMEGKNYNKIENDRNQWKTNLIWEEYIWKKTLLSRTVLANFILQKIRITFELKTLLSGTFLSVWICPTITQIEFKIIP